MPVLAQYVAAWNSLEPARESRAYIEFYDFVQANEAELEALCPRDDLLCNLMAAFGFLTVRLRTRLALQLLTSPLSSTLHHEFASAAASRRKRKRTQITSTSGKLLAWRSRVPLMTSCCTQVDMNVSFYRISLALRGNV